MAWRFLAVAAAVAALLGAGATPAATPDSTQRLRAFERLLDAALANDEPAMWRTLSRISQRRLGPTLADFRRRGARGVRDGVGPFLRGPYQVVVNLRFDRDLGLVAISGGRERGAFAVPLRREGGIWKVEIDPLFTVEAVRPIPGERVIERTQLFAEVAAPGRLRVGFMWFDGVPFDARVYWSRDQKHMSIWGEAPQPLLTGRHTVVAFAASGREAAANAWAFYASKKG